MQKINFQNLPSTNTPLNASNLNLLQNNVEDAINEIIDSGSNTNGNYLKFSDGTLIQWGKVSLTTGTTAYTTGGITRYRSDELTKTFPIPFYSQSTPVVFPQVEGGVGAIYFVYTGITYLNTTITLESTSSNFSRNIFWQAIGRWK